MTDYGLTSSGFLPKTTEVLQTEIAAAAKEELGAGLNTESDSLAGIWIRIFADRLADLWSVGQDVYTAGDVAQAVDAALDALCALTGTVREAATESTATLYATGTPTTVLSVGRVVSVDGAPDSRFATDAAATIAAATAWSGTTAYVVGDVVTNDGNIYYCLTAGTSAGSGGPTGTGTDITDGTVHWRYLGDGTGYITVAVTAEETGPTVGNSYTITEIETPVSGWENATNVADATVGQDAQSNASLRAMRIAELSGIGAGTLDTIQAAVASVTGISDVVVTENNTDITDGDGVPPHRIHVVVEPGTATDADIAQAIFDTKPGGIGTYGSESASVQDSKGISHTIYWDEATAVDIYVDIEIDVIADEFPTDGEDQIKNAIVAYGDALLIGRDVIAEKIKSIIWSISGVHDVTAYDIEDADPPSGDTNVTIGTYEVADFDTANIDIVVTEVDPS